MAFTIKGIIDLKGILFLMLLTVTSEATNLDCYGKAFHCVNSTHFMICVDLGRGTSTTIDDFIIPCPSPTVCRKTNRFECEFPLPSIQSSTVATTEPATSESAVTTFAPLPPTSIPFDEYFNTVSTTTLSEISQIELQPSSADNPLPVKPITGGLDTKNLSPTEKVITDTSISSNVNLTPEAEVDLNSKPIDINSSNVENNDILNLIVIPNDVTSENINQVDVTQAQVTGPNKFKTEFDSVSNSTSNGDEQKENTENVFTTDSRSPLENITETIIINAITEEPMVYSTEVSSTVTENTVTIEQVIARSFQDVNNSSLINNNSTLLDINTHLKPTQNVKQINESQSIGDIIKNAAGNFNGISEVLVNAPAIDVTSAMHEQTVIEKDYTKGFQEATVNATITDDFSILTDMTTPLESTQEINKVNSSQSVKDVINDVTDTLSDVSLSHQTTTNVIPTAAIDRLDTRIPESLVLNTTSRNETTPTSTTSELTGNTENVFITDSRSTFENITETTIINAITEVPINKSSTEVSSTVTEKRVTTEQNFAPSFQVINNTSVIDNNSTLLDINIRLKPTQNVKQINESQSIGETIKNAADIFNGVSEVSVNAPAIDVTSAMHEQTVIEKDYTKGFQDATVNATITDDFSMLTDTTRPLESTQEINKVNSSQSVTDVINDVTDTLSDVSLSHQTTTNVIPTAAIDRLDTRIPESLVLNTTSGNETTPTSTTSELTGNTENVFITDSRSTFENITETTIINAITEVPINKSSTEVSSTVTENRVTTEQNFAPSFQVINNTSVIDNNSTLLDINIRLKPTQNVKQINESQSIGDTIKNAADIFNGVSEVSVNAPAIDVTSAMHEQTVIEKDYTKGFQDATVNATITDDCSMLTDTTPPLESTQEINKVNSSQSVTDVINDVTDTLSDVSLSHQTTTNVIPTAAIDRLDTRIPESLVLNTTSGNETTPTSTTSELTGNTENVFITDSRSTFENITETTIINAITEVPINKSSTEVSSTVTEKRVTTEQNFAPSFQVINNTSVIDNNSTLLDINIRLKPTQNVKQINESQSIGDTIKNAADIFNGVSEVSVNAPAIDVTSAMHEQTVIEKDYTKGFQDATVNATITDDFSMLTDTTRPLESTQEINKVNSSQSVTDVINDVTDTLSDVSLSHQTTTNVIPTAAIDRLDTRIPESLVLNTTSGNETTPTSTTSELTGNTENVFITDSRSTFENITETTIINAITEVPINKSSTEVSSTVTENRVTTEQNFAPSFQVINNTSVIDNNSTLLDINIRLKPTQNVKQINESQSIGDTIKNAADIFNGVSEVSVNAPAIDVTSAMHEQTVIEKDYTKGFQDATVNATITDDCSMLTDTTPPLESTQEINKVNSSQSVTDVINDVTDTLSDVSLSHQTTTNVIPTAAIDRLDTRIPESLVLNTTSGNETTPTSTTSELTGNTENVFITDSRSTFENITETTIINAITEVPINKSSTEVSSTVTEKRVTTEQNFAPSFQVIYNTSVIDNNSTLLDINIRLKPTQNVKQINESQSIGDTIKNAADIFNGVSEVSVNAPAIDVTSAMHEQTVIEKDYTKGFQDATVNATITDDFSMLTDTTTPLESTQEINKVNSSQSVKDVINHVTKTFSDVSLSNQATTDVIPTAAIDQLDTRIPESLVLNTTSGNETTSTTSEQTGNTESVFTKVFIEPLVGVTEIAFINTEASVNTILTDITSSVTEQTVTNEQASANNLEDPPKLTISENLSIPSVTVSTVEQPQTAITKALKSVNRTIDRGSAVFNETNLNIGTKINILTTMNGFETRVTELPADRSNTVEVAEKPNYQASNKTTTTPAYILYHSSSATEHVVPTEPVQEENKIANGSISEKILHITTITDAVVGIENKTSNLINTSTNNYFNNDIMEIPQNNSIPEKMYDNKHESTVPVQVKESQLTSSNNFESDLIINVDTASVKTSEEALNTEILKLSENFISSTTEPNLVTEIVTSTLFNNLEIIANTSTATPVLNMTTDNFINDPQNDAENIGYDINNKVGSITHRLTLNEKVLSTNDNRASTQAYKSDSNSKIETSTPSVLISEALTTMFDPLFLEQRPIIGEIVGNNKLLKVNINVESGNEPPTESATLSSVSVSSKSAVTESSTYRKDINQINGVISTVSHDNSSIALIDEQTQVVMDRLSTPIRNVTDSLHVDSVSFTKEHTNRAISTDEYKAIVTTTDIVTLSPTTVIVDQNQTLSSEVFKSLSKTDTIPKHTSASLPSTVMKNMETTEAAYVSPDYTLAEKNKSFYDGATIYNTNDQTQTETIKHHDPNTNSHNMIVNEIDKTTVKSDVFMNVEENSGNTQKLESQLSVTAKLSNYDTTMNPSTVATYTFSEIPSSIDPALEKNAHNITGSKSVENTVGIRLKAGKSNGYLSSSNDAYINNSSTTENNVLGSSFMSLDLVQKQSNQILSTAEGIKTSDVTTESPNISHNIGPNVQYNTPLISSNNSLILNEHSKKETIMPVSWTEPVINSLENNVPTLSNSPTKVQESNLLTTNEKTGLSTPSSTPGNDAINASTDNSITTTTDVSVLENIGNSIIIKTNISNGSTTNTNILENVTSSSVTINQRTVTISKHTLRDINLLSNTQENIEKPALASSTEIPIIVNTDKNSNSIIKENILNEKTSYKVMYPEKQTNPIRNITLNSLSLTTSTHEPVATITDTNLDHTVITIRGNERTSTFSDSLIPDITTRTTSVINSITEPSRSAAVEITLNSELSPELRTLNANKENKLYTTDDPKVVIPVPSPMHTTILPKNDDVNAQKGDSLLTQTSGSLDPVTLSIMSQFVTKSVEKEVSGMVGALQSFVNNNHDTNNMDIIPTVSNEAFSVTLPETANSYSIVTKPIPTSVTLSTDLGTSLKQSGKTISGGNTDVLNAASKLPINYVDSSTITELPLDQTELPRRSTNSNQVSQTSSSLIAGSIISTTHASSDINRQVPLKATGNYVTKTEPTTGPVRRGLVTADDSQVFIKIINTMMNDKVLTSAAFSTGQPTETSKKETNANIENIFIYNTDRVHSLEVDKESSTQIKAPSVQNRKSIEVNAKSTPSVQSPRSPDFSVPTEILTTSDVLVHSNTAGEKTHSGIISFITESQKLRESKEKKEKSETKETEAEEQQKYPVNVELASLQDKGLFAPSTDIPVAHVEEIDNISTREDMLMKTEKKYNNTIKDRENYSTKINADKNINNGTNTDASGYKYQKETPTHELIKNSTASTNDNHTSNNKSQDQNMNIPQANNKPVISNDQSSTSRYMSQTKSTAAGDTQTSGFPVLEPTTRNTELNKFSCKQKKRGRYADDLDCRKFYICPGNKSSHVIEGTCPVNTVFSEINKQCTKNLSHCIRNNQFRCVTEGRFSDFLNDNIYYICVMNNLSHFIRFKLQCQNGYHLNKTSVRCVLNNESTSTSDSKNVSEQSSSSIKQDTTEKPEKKFKCKKEGVFPDPSNCKKYIECTKIDSSYRQKKKKCDSGEIFHKDKKKCVDADSYEC